MTINHLKLRELFKNFWENKNHKEIPFSPLVLQNDPTTLFTSSGMQPLIPYLSGETHPLGKRLYDIQPSLRTQDIEEVGDNRHTTFFEMMGNWSLGDYFKKEQLTWIWEFLTEVIKLPKDKLYVTVFKGNELIPRDEESAKIWASLGISENHVFYYGAEKNWWSRSGTPDQMPAGEIGGPDSEIFYEFTQVKHDPKYGEKCHPNCDCGRFLEIGNSVFIQYRKKEDGALIELPQKNVDFGGGLERILAAINNNPDIFQTDVFEKIIKTIVNKYYTGAKDENFNPLSYPTNAIIYDSTKSELKDKNDTKQAVRIIADHIKAAVFLMKDGVLPSNKEQGYVLRRLLRRSAIKLHKLLRGIITSNEASHLANFHEISNAVIDTYEDIYFDSNSDKTIIGKVINDEIDKFRKTLIRGLQEIQKIEIVDGKTAFNLYQTFGFPLELTEELVKEKGQHINHEEFEKEFNKHKDLSRKSSQGMFKGGLADQNEKTIKYHTATHLIHQALFDVIGNDVRQEGSNITQERLRFDFYSSVRPTPDQIKKVEETVNQKVNESLPISFKILPKEEAMKIGAKSFFKEKYPQEVKVYFIGSASSPQVAYSKEFCGGPHVANTKEIGKIEIYKFEKIGSNLYRIYAK